MSEGKITQTMIITDGHGGVHQIEGVPTWRCFQPCEGSLFVSVSPCAKSRWWSSHIRCLAWLSAYIQNLGYGSQNVKRGFATMTLSCFVYILRVPVSNSNHSPPTRQSRPAFQLNTPSEIAHQKSTSSARPPGIPDSLKRKALRTL